MKKGVIIVGSSRSNGDSALVAQYFQELSGYDVIDLKEKRIEHFDYDFENSDDDFNALFKGIVCNYELLIFVSPVYWYTMSGVLKVFFDRISDFLYKEKEYGRALRGKEMGVLSCSNNEDIVTEFEMPFKRTASYLEMNYTGYRHLTVQEGVLSIKSKEIMKEFHKNVELKTTN